MQDGNTEKFFRWLDEVRAGRTPPLPIILALKELALVTNKTDGGWQLTPDGHALHEKLL